MCSTRNYIQYPVINQNGKGIWKGMLLLLLSHFIHIYKNRTTIWYNNSIPRPILRENHNSERYMHPNIHCSTIYSCQNMEATETEEWIKCGICMYISQPSLIAQLVNLPAVRETWVWFLVWEDPLEKSMATGSSILTWKAPGTEEPGRLSP